MTCSLYFAPLPARNRAAMEQIAAQPMVHAMALTLPAAAWTAAGARHPLGNNYTGFVELDPKVLESESLHDTEKTSASSYCAKSFRSPVQNTSSNNFAAGRCRLESRDHLQRCKCAQPSLAAGSLIEQRRLMQMLKKLKPGPFGK